MKQLAAQTVAVVSALPSASSALAGAILRLSTNNKAYWCDGSAWVALDITVSASAPSNPQTNDLWVDIS
jgi:hypothetical protein